MTDRITGEDKTSSLEHLHAHLQDAIAFEFWTIPYYLSAMYSIRDPTSEAYQLIQSIVNQEMLHTQLVCNLANAFGCSPKFSAPVYGGSQIPHLDFTLDDPNPALLFTPFSTEIGPLDRERVNTMCLIEYPQWRSRNQSKLQEDRTQYGSVGEFYAAISTGITELRNHIVGNARQVDFFGAYYNNLTTTTITKSGIEGYRQAIELLHVIVEQGEGQTRGDADIRPAYRNTADGVYDSWPHFRKLMQIRETQPYPEIYAADPEPDAAGREAQTILMRDFAKFIKLLNALFQGDRYQGFGALMAKLGGAILNCWRRNAVPRFS